MLSGLNLAIFVNFCPIVSSLVCFVSHNRRGHMSGRLLSEGIKTALTICSLTLSYTGFLRLVLHGGEGGGGTKCPRPFSLKRLKLLQLNLVH